jgi:hypothetical protein
MTHLYMGTSLVLCMAMSAATGAYAALRFKPFDRDSDSYINRIGTAVLISTNAALIGPIVGRMFSTMISSPDINHSDIVKAAALGFTLTAPLAILAKSFLNFKTSLTYSKQADTQLNQLGSASR